MNTRKLKVPFQNTFLLTIITLLVIITGMAESGHYFNAICLIPFELVLIRYTSKHLNEKGFSND